MNDFDKNNSRAKICVYDMIIVSSALKHDPRQIPLEKIQKYGV